MATTKGEVLEAVYEDGVLKLPPEVHEVLKKTKHVHVQVEGDTIILVPTPTVGPLWEGMTPEERAAEFRAWASQQTDAPDLPKEAFDRESIYD